MSKGSILTHDRFIGNRRPAWEEVGTVVDEKFDPVSALSFIDADFEIVKAETVDRYNGKDYRNPDRFSIIREPDDGVDFARFGYCGKDFEIVQRRDFAKALDKLTDRWPLHAIGILNFGQSVFWVLDAGEMEIGGDLLHQYFIAHDKVDGGTSAKFLFTPLRMFCQNQLMSAYKMSTLTASLEHRTGFGANFNFKVDLIAKLADAQRLTMNTLDIMSKVKITDKIAEDIIAKAYPQMGKPSKVGLLDDIEENDPELGEFREQGSKALASFEYYKGRTNRFREDAHTLYQKFNDEFPQTAGTLWAVYNGISEHADHRDGADSVPVSLLFGDRAKEKVRAFTATMAYMPLAV